jgi:hypothetical protein
MSSTVSGLSDTGVFMIVEDRERMPRRILHDHGLG